MNFTNTKKFALTVLVGSFTSISGISQIIPLKEDPTGRYDAIQFPVAHSNPVSGTYVSSAFFSFSLARSPFGIVEGNGIGVAYVGGRRTLANVFCVAPALTLDTTSNTVSRNDAGNVDFTLRYSSLLVDGASETAYQVNGTLKSVNPYRSLFFKRVTNVDNQAKLTSAERVVDSEGKTAIVVSSPTNVVVEASGGPKNLAGIRDKIRPTATRKSGNKRFFQ